MTIRAHLNRRLRWVFSVMCSGFALGVAGIFIGRAQGGQPFMAIFLPGFGVFCAAVMFAHFAIRCPLCRGNFGPLIVHRPGLSMSERVRYCPYCGSGLDEEIMAQERIRTQ